MYPKEISRKSDTNPDSSKEGKKKSPKLGSWHYDQRGESSVHMHIPKESEKTQPQLVKRANFDKHEEKMASTSLEMHYRFIPERRLQ